VNWGVEKEKDHRQDAKAPRKDLSQEEETGFSINMPLTPKVVLAPQDRVKALSNPGEF
jgi:hypothetical protein